MGPPVGAYAARSYFVAPSRQIVAAAGTILSCPDLCRVNRWCCRDGSLPSFLLFHRRDHECTGRDPHGRGSHPGKSSRASSGLPSNRAGTPNLAEGCVAGTQRTSHPGQDPLRSPSTRCPHLEESPLAPTVFVNDLHRAEDSVRRQHRPGLRSVHSILVVVCRRSIQQRLADHSTVVTQNTAMRKNYACIN